MNTTRFTLSLLALLALITLVQLSYTATTNYADRASAFYQQTPNTPN